MIGWQVERARHVILLREKLQQQQQQQQQQRNGGAELSKLDKDALNNTLRPRHVTGSSANQLLSDKERERSSTDVEKSPVDERKGLDSVASVDRSTALVVRCLKLMLYNRTEARDRLLAAVRPTDRTHCTHLPSY